MLRYDIIERLDDDVVPLAGFSAPWSASVPIFHGIAKAYFRRLRPDGVCLQLFATLEADTPCEARQALVCTARQRDGGGPFELRSGPLLEAALRAQRA
jgi:hypothetical protein